jgi:hypothetical protein
MSASTDLKVQIRERLGAAKLSRLAIELEQALADEGVETTRIREGAPVDARAWGAEIPGALVLKLVPSLLGKAAAAILGWFRRSGERSVELSIDGRTIKLTKASAEQQQQLIDLMAASLQLPPGTFGDVGSAGEPERLPAARERQQLGPGPSDS